MISGEITLRERKAEETFHMLDRITTKGGGGGGGVGCCR